jgi:hypothetical protein
MSSVALWILNRNDFNPKVLYSIDEFHFTPLTLWAQYKQNAVAIRILELLGNVKKMNLNKTSLDCDVVVGEYYFEDLYEDELSDSDLYGSWIYFWTVNKMHESCL